MPAAKNFFNHEQTAAIEQAIMRAEKNTSGEIRVHIEDKCNGGVMTCAVRAFRKLGMHKTALRNGVMIYLAVKNREFAIFGDEGINKAVPENFWDKIKNKMQAHFIEGRFTEGLCEGIESAGIQLLQHFPLEGNDKNELRNEVTFGNR